MQNRTFTPINILILGSLILVVIITVILVFAVQNLTENTLQKSSNLVGIQHQKLHNLLNMHIAGQSRIIHLQQIQLLHDDFEKDQALMSFYQNSSDYVFYRDRISELVTETPYEQEWMQTILQIAQETAPIHSRIAELAMNQDKLLARHLLTTQGMELLNQFTEKVNEFSDYQLEEINRAMLSAKHDVDFLISRVLGLAITIILLSIGFATIIIRKFNLINRDLQLSNDLLEQRVNERTHELTQAQNALVSKNKELEKLSTTDKLTGLNNRYRMDQFLDTAHERFNRHGESYQVMFLDIDHFKAINDNYGHDIGDCILRQFSEVLTEQLGFNHLIGRWGGEEFIVLSANVNLEYACKEAEKFRIAVNQTKFEQGLNVTVSIGITEVNYGDLVADVINRADIALYKAKNTGRNQVSSALSRPSLAH